MTFLNKKDDRNKVGNRCQNNKDMPDKVGKGIFFGIKNKAQGIKDPTQKDQKKKDKTLVI